jgi:hypothetical protein
MLRYCNGLISSCPIVNKWNITEKELDGFLAVNLYFGIVRITRKKDYWQAVKKFDTKNVEKKNDLETIF